MLAVDVLNDLAILQLDKAIKTPLLELRETLPSSLMGQRLSNNRNAVIANPWVRAADGFADRETSKAMIFNVCGDQAQITLSPDKRHLAPEFD